MSAVDPNARFDLSKATALLIDGSRHSLDVAAQILKGFGLTRLHRCHATAEAEKLLRSREVDLIIIDPAVDGGAGYDFVGRLRRSGGLGAYAPVLLVSGHVRRSDVSRARETGANYVVTKPLSPMVLLQRLLWIARDPRPFVEIGEYVGPDRRYKPEDASGPAAISTRAVSAPAWEGAIVQI